MTDATAALKAVPAPTPTTMPATTSRASEAARIAKTRRTRPTGRTTSPTAYRRDGDQRAVNTCATAAEPKTENVIAPASACEVWCSVPERNEGASEVKKPNIAKL